MKKNLLIFIFLFSSINVFPQDQSFSGTNPLLNNIEIGSTQYFFYQEYVAQIENNSKIMIFNNPNSVINLSDVRSLNLLYDIEIDSESDFFTIWDKYLLIDSGTSPGLRNLKIVRLQDPFLTFNCKIISGNNIFISNDTISIVETIPISNISPDEIVSLDWNNLEAALEWSRDGFRSIVLKEYYLCLEKFEKEETGKIILMIR